MPRAWVVQKNTFSFPSWRLLRPLLEHMEESRSMTAGKSLPKFGLMCAREKGKKKTAALNVLARPVREIEQDLQNDFKQDNPEAQDRELPRLLVDHFSLEKLHQVMSQNNNKVLGACGELTQFYNMLHHYKTNSTMGVSF